MRCAALLVCTLALAAPGRPAAAPGWSSAVQRDYETLLREARQYRWQHGDSVQPSEPELKLATFSAAMLTRMTGHLDHYDDIQRRLQLQQHTVQVNLGRVELDTLIDSYRTGGDVSKEDLRAAFNSYMEMQKKMASSLGLESVHDLWWSAFEMTSGSAQDQLETMWSQTASLVSSLSRYLQSLPAPDGQTIENLILACAAGDDCTTLTKMALPYPDISGALTNLLREKHMDAEALCRLSDEFLTLLGLPAAPAELWKKSQFGAADTCSHYVDAEKVRVCTDGTEAGVRMTLALMTDSEYLRLAAGQEPPFQTPAFPGFERAVSGAVELLALQPSLVQQLVYGYGTGRAGRLSAVSLYLARGARPAGQPDPLCHGDFACQQTANGLMEAAVTRLLPLGYHVGSLRWLQSASVSGETGWQAALGRTLSLTVTAAPADVDRRFYSASRHAGRALAEFAAFQLRQAACPHGGECLPAGASSAGRVLRSVMESGSSMIWDAMLTEATGGTALSAAPLLDYFGPLKSLVQPRNKQQAVLKTLELEDEVAERRRSLHSASQTAARSDHSQPAGLAASSSNCSAISNKTDSEQAICAWYDDFDDLKMNLTMTEWEFGLDVSMWDKMAQSRKSFVSRRHEARANLSADVNEWIYDGNSSNELALLGQMFVLSEKDIGEASEDNLDKLTKATYGLVSKYVGVKVCPHNNKDCKDTEKLNIWAIQSKMTDGSVDNDTLKYYWSEYRAAAKSDMASTFGDYISSGKDAAKDAGLDHYGQLQLLPYGYGDKNETLLEELADIWKQETDGVSLDSMYQQLHTYVRYTLAGADDRRPIPSHMFREMFAEDWRNIYIRTAPYSNLTLDITPALNDQSYDIVKIRDDAVRYLKALNLTDLKTNTHFINDSHWDPCSDDTDCAALAWTSGVNDDVRIRMTPEVTMDNYELVHMKAAELEYYLSYMGQDPEFRGPANPAFTEAVAGAISLSVLSPAHLENLGLLNVTDDKLWYNYLYRRALQYLAPLPFSYVAQKWQWGVYMGDYDGDNWERKWWELREDIQGVQPAEKRDKDDADPLAVPTLARDQPGFQRYFAILVQFQLFEHFCVEAGQYDPAHPTTPLHECDLSGSTVQELIDMMELGNSMRWREVIHKYSENGTLTSDSMIKYFAPLNVYLTDFAQRHGLKSGWDSNLDDYWDDDETDDATVPIVVGVVLGVLVLIVLIAYFVVRVRRGRAE